MTARLRLAIAVCAASAAGALFVLELDDFSVARLSLIVAVGLTMVGAGLVAATNGRDRIGVIIVLAGFAWLLERLLQAVPTGLTGTIGYLFTGLWGAFLAHAVLSFPSGRLASTAVRGLVAAGYVINGVLTLPYLLFEPSLKSRGISDRNVLLVHGSAGLAHRIDQVTDILTVVWAIAVVAAIAGKAMAASPAARRSYGAVWTAGGVLFLTGAVLVTPGLGPVTVANAHGRWLEIVAGLTAVTLAVSLWVARVSEDRLVALVADLETVGPGETLRNALRRALADPTLDVVYLRAGSGGWIDEIGQTMTAPLTLAGRAVTPIERGGKPVAALVHDSALLSNPERLRAATGAASLAFHNEHLKAELRAQLHDVQVSRARIVATGDRERRRVERNLHDGAQQRLVGLALMLRLVSRKAAADPGVTELLAEAARELDDALEELRELARGIHPAIVTDAGLVGSLETLAERPGVPVELCVDLPDRLPDLVEVGAYYVVAEALTNAKKHAEAEHIRVDAVLVDGALRVAVSDDGRGGATAAPGSGLEGLADRVGALGGRLVIDSDPARGTTVVAEIPLRGPPTPGRDRRQMAALRWIGWEDFEVPAELYDQLMDEDNLNHVKAVMACAGGAERITRRERDWIVGFHSAAGTADWVLDAIASYDGADRLLDIMELPSMTATRRGVLYDAVRLCSSDGALTSAEIDHLRRGADEMGVPRDVLAELQRIVIGEHALRRQRYELIVAPALPVLALDHPTLRTPAGPAC